MTVQENIDEWSMAEKLIPIALGKDCISTQELVERIKNTNRISSTAIKRAVWSLIESKTIEFTSENKLIMAP